jgi:D-alanyl-D-alanine carboxypeptidase/D-alanyl-D-alanine-endopeptidase (penicillin-binding protein 4)
MYFSRLLLNAVFLIGIFLAKSLQAQENSFDKAAQRLQQSPIVKGASMSWCFRDVESGQVLSAYNADQYLLPASTAKTFSSAAALALLGKEFRFTTWLIVRGKIKDGVISGDLIVRGGGDPSLGSGKAGAATADEVLKHITTLLKEKGIRKIKGDLIVDPHFFRYDHTAIPRDWPWEDLGNYYGAGVYGLNWRENAFNIQLKAGDSTNALATIESTQPTVLGAEIINHVRTCESNSEVIYLYSTPLSTSIHVDGSIVKGERLTERGALPNPAFQFLGELDQHLRKNDIRIQGNALIEDGSVGTSMFDTLGKLESPTLQALVTEINMNSNNVFAEAITHLLGKKMLNSSRSEDGAKAIQNWMRTALQLSDSGMVLRDGSGLSRTNHISTSFHTQFLRKMAQQKDFSIYLNSLPEAGKSGTMKNFPLIEGVHVKSGSIGGIRGYAGYLRDAENRLISFSILLNHFRSAGQEMKNLCAGLMQEAVAGNLPKPFRFAPLNSISDTLYQLPEIAWYTQQITTDPSWEDLRPVDQEALRLRLYLVGEPNSEEPYKTALFRNTKDPWTDVFRFRIHVMTREIERWDKDRKSYVKTGLMKPEIKADKKGKPAKKK